MLSINKKKKGNQTKTSEETEVHSVSVIRDHGKDKTKAPHF
jgi:hypothetical protein